MAFPRQEYWGGVPFPSINRKETETFLYSPWSEGETQDNECRPQGVQFQIQGDHWWWELERKQVPDAGNSQKACRVRLPCGYSEVLEHISFLVESCTRWTWSFLSAVQISPLVVSDSATPWTAAHQASLSITNSRSLLKLKSIESVMPSNHPVPFSSHLQSFPAFPEESEASYQLQNCQMLLWKLLSTLSVCPLGLLHWYVSLLPAPWAAFHT